MENTTPKSGSELVKGIIASAVEGVVGRLGDAPAASGVPAASKVPAAVAGGVAGALQVVVERKAVEVIEIAPSKKEIDGEVAAVAVVSEEEGRALSLSPKQCLAIKELTSGSNQLKAADAAGVDRSTLNRWINHDPAFRAAFNAWQVDVLSTTKGQMVATTKDAMETVIKAIRGGDAKLAWKLLESLGLTGPVTPGPTNVEELKRKEEMERKKKKVEEERERRKMDNDELMNPFG